MRDHVPYRNTASHYEAANLLPASWVDGARKVKGPELPT
jgi:hypothetical protein